MKRINVFFCILIYVLTSCNLGKANSVVYTPIDTTNVTHLTGEVIMEIKSHGCSEILDFGDYIVMAAGIDGKLFNVVSKNGVVVESVGHIGKGNNEFLRIANIQKVNNRDFMVYDGVRKKLSYYNIDSILNGKIIPYNSINIKSNDIINQVYQLSEDNFLYSYGFVESKAIRRFSVVSKDGEIKTRYDKYPGNEDSLLMVKAYNLQPPLVVFDPSGKNMVVANKPIGAIMDIFNIQQDNIELKETKYFISPIVETNEKGIIINPSDIIAGFTDIFMTDNGIYATYIGAKAIQYPQTKIIKFNKVGVVEKVYKTDYLNSQIIFDEKTNAFYTSTLLPSGEFVLMRYKL